MNSWQIIREYFVKDSKPNTVGYLKELNRAIKLLILLEDNIKDKQKSIGEMNLDSDCNKALLNKAILDKI